MADVFVDPEKGKEMSKLVENFESVKQAGDCEYPEEPDYQNPPMDNTHDNTNIFWITNIWIFITNRIFHPQE